MKRNFCRIVFCRASFYWYGKRVLVMVIVTFGRLGLTFVMLLGFGLVDRTVRSLLVSLVLLVSYYC